MGKAVITIKDDGPDVSIDFKFDPPLKDTSEASPAQTIAIVWLDTLDVDQEKLKKALASSVKPTEGKSQPLKEKTDARTNARI
jgi:hypothetical protein